MNLNPSQKFVADFKGGPLLVLAPPGSGKTASIVERAVSLIKEGLPAERLLLVTFSRKACDEMSERIGKMVSTPPTILTLHKLGLEIIRDNPEMCNRMRGVTIEDIPKSLYKKACAAVKLNNQNTINETWRQLQSLRFTRTYQKSGQYADALLKIVGKETEPAAINTYVQAYKKYDELKQKKNVIDLNDAIVLAAEALKKHPALRRKYALKYPFIIVDEAQDSNWAQYNLVARIAQDHRNIMLVGDDDQTVYKFQGADPVILQTFKQSYGAKVVLFDKNYRSSPPIVNVSDLLISHNQTRFSKNVHSMNFDFDFEYPELMVSERYSDFIDKLIKRIRRENASGVSLSDMAVLYRSNKLSEGLIEAFTDHNIPFKVLGGRRRDNEPEIDAFAYYIRLLLNPYDYQAFKKLGFLYKLKATNLDKAVRLSKRSAEPMKTPMECSNQNSAMTSFSSECRAILIALRDSSPEEAFRKLRSTHTFTAAMLRIRASSEKSSDASIDQEAYLDEYESRIDLFLSGKSVSRLTRSDRYRLLAETHFSGDDMDMGDPNGVTLGTIHKSKGLEWASVHVIGMSEGLLPGFRPSNEPSKDDIESERSIAFVAITRARERLYLHHSAEIRTGAFITKGLLPSRFLSEMKYSV